MDNERESLLALVAKLYYIDDMGQNEIAGLVGVSRSQVSRILTAARQKGIVRITVAPYDPRDGDLEAALIKRFKLHHAVVVKTVEGATVDQVRRTIGYFAGPILSEWLGPNMIVGVAGGRTLSALVQYLRPSSGMRPGITAVQLMGNVGASVRDYEAAELAHLVAERVSGAFYALSAPALAPDSATRNLYLAHANIRHVWQLYQSMAIAVVGIGSMDDSVFVERGVLSKEVLDRLCAVGAVGEICGRFYDQAGRECQTEHHDRVVSIELERLRKVPEVVGVTNGSHRTEAIRAALAGGLIKSLVMDQQSAASVLAAS